MSSPPDSPMAAAGDTEKEQPPSPSLQIGNEVEAAAVDFWALHKKLDLLLGNVKDHHASMLDLSEKRLKEAWQFEILMKDTPLEKITGNTNYSPSKPESPKRTKSSTCIKDDDDRDDDDTVKSSDEESDPAKPSSPKANGIKTVSDGKSKGAKFAPVNAALAPATVDGVVVENSDFSDVDPTLGAACRAAHDLTAQYASKHKENIWKYVEEWGKVVSSKVKGWMAEYHKLQNNLKHYEKKVKDLREDISKQEGKNKKIGGKQYEKMHRNGTKLEGAREAHNSYGETLILLLEEVTERAWRDMLPLLMMELKFQTSYYADQAKIFAKLEGATSALVKIGEENGVELGGRLKDIREKRPEEIHTGEREMVSLPKRKSKAIVEAACC